ncbi:MAG: amidohydrolase family protein [Gemmatimonadetes bacterium]|nr:amidohydrolase family protein [Gemmatimonadota bacterium]
MRSAPHPKSRRFLLPVLSAGLAFGGCGEPPEDLLILGGTTFDGSGEAPVLADVAVTGDRITLVGDAVAAGLEARDTVSALGLWVTPGFIDMHSHAELEEEWGRDGAPFVYQGITTAVLGVDGGGAPEIGRRFAAFADSGIGLNAMLYVGHGAVRRRVMGMEDRAPTTAELDEMRALVRQGMEEGAFGLSSGLFYTPGYYAETEELIELAEVAAEYGGIYDTHDRDLGASYEGIGYLASIEEGIRIGEEGGTRVIFSHFNAQGAANYGRASEGAALIEAARERGIDVQAAQHVYTATQSNLRAYAIPRWAAAGGDEVMLARFEDPDTVTLLDVQTMEMLEIRGGAERIYFSDPRPHLNGKHLAQVAEEWGVPVPEAVRRILREGNAAVQNRGLYDPQNTRYLALQPWMMTCTDGRTPSPETAITHPRPFGAFTKKLRDYVLDEGFLAPEFAIRSMTGLAADFLRLPDRGYLRPGMKADIAVLDPQNIQDRATYEEPRLPAEGTVHVLVNGVFALRDGTLTGALAGRALPRPSGH